MTGLGVVLIIGAIVVAVIGVSFVWDIKQSLPPEASGSTVDPNTGQTYTFLRIRSLTVGWIVTVLTFVIAAVLLIVGIVLVV